MTKELIENTRAIIVPYMAHDLRRINYENMGEIDAAQFKEDMNEILDLATKALEQQPCEDCISRQAAIDALDTVLWGVEWDKALATAMLKDLPPVQPKPRAGYVSIDDVMSVFDDFMCGEVDEDGTNTFLEMLKDKAENEAKE